MSFCLWKILPSLTLSALLLLSLPCLCFVMHSSSVQKVTIHPWISLTKLALCCEYSYAQLCCKTCMFYAPAPCLLQQHTLMAIEEPCLASAAAVLGGKGRACGEGRGWMGLRQRSTIWIIALRPCRMLPAAETVRYPVLRSCSRKRSAGYAACTLWTCACVEHGTNIRCVCSCSMQNLMAKSETGVCEAFEFLMSKNRDEQVLRVLNGTLQPQTANQQTCLRWLPQAENLLTRRWVGRCSSKVHKGSMCIWYEFCICI